jgi:hypothetical protein
VSTRDARAVKRIATVCLALTAFVVTCVIAAEAREIVPWTAVRAEAARSSHEDRGHHNAREAEESDEHTIRVTPAGGATERVVVSIPAFVVERVARVAGNTLTTHVLLTTRTGSARVTVAGAPGCSATLAPSVVATLMCRIPEQASTVTIVGTLSDGRVVRRQLTVQRS